MAGTVIMRSILGNQQALKLSSLDLDLNQSIQYRSISTVHCRILGRGHFVGSFFFLISCSFREKSCKIINWHSSEPQLADRLPGLTLVRSVCLKFRLHLSLSLNDRMVTLRQNSC